MDRARLERLDPEAVIDLTLRHQGRIARLEAEVAALKAARAAEHPPVDDQRMLLSARRQEITALIAEGLTDAEIAWRLTLTVGNHVAQIRRVLGLTNRVQLAVWAVKQGLY